jgi:hypothetical protein
MNTWTSKSIDSKGAHLTNIERKSRGLKFWSKKGSSNASTPKSTNDLEEPVTFWPYHLLPNDCNNVRILTWGYNSKVSEFFHGSANKGTILSHSRDLLGDLTRERLSCVGRRLTFSTSETNQVVLLAKSTNNLCFTLSWR